MPAEREGAVRGSLQHGRRLLHELRWSQRFYSLNHDSPPVGLGAVLCGPIQHTFVNERRSAWPSGAHVGFDRISSMRCPRSQQVGGVPNPQLEVRVATLFGPHQPPAAVVTKDNRIYNPEMLDEHCDL